MKSTLLKQAFGSIIFFLTFSFGMLLTALTGFNETAKEAPLTAPISETGSYKVNKASSFQFPNDPHELKELINDKNSDFLIIDLWEHLSISSDMKLVKYPFREVSNEVQQFTSCSSCLAEITEINLDEDDENELLLSISSHNGHGDFRLIAFDKIDGKWKPIGYTDNDINKYYSPLMRTVEYGDNKFLVLECMGGSGTGMRLSFERWYQIINRELVEVLTFPKESYNSSVSIEPITTSTASVAGFTERDGKEQFTLDFNVDLSAHFPDCEENQGNEENLTAVFKDVKKGVFVRNYIGEFVLDEKSSSISVEEISSVYAAKGITPDDLHQFYGDNTKRILKENTGCRADWMRYWMRSANL